MLRLAFVAMTAGLALIGPCSAVKAEDTPPNAPEDASRYTFHRMGDHFIRLDSRTGQVAQCGWGTAGWSCNMVPDERAALESEIARIQRENGTLKRSLLSHGIDLPADVKPDIMARKLEATPPKQPEVAPGKPQYPSDAELDRAFAFMKKVWRWLVEMMVDFQRDMQRRS